MPTGHKLTKLVRAYLLGQLNDAENADVEARYFTDRDFFESVQIMEQQMIDDYAASRLDPEDCRAFEERYLSVPSLCEKVKMARARAAQSSAASESGNSGRLVRYVSRFAMAAVIAGVLFVSILKVTEHRRLPDAQFTAGVRLTPGITMAGGSQMAEIAPPPEALLLELEYPATEAGNGLVVIQRLNADGSQSEVWRSGAAAPPAKTAAGGFVYPVSVPAGLLQPGDYMAELRDDKGNGLETYLFRIISARR